MSELLVKKIETSKKNPKIQTCTVCTEHSQDDKMVFCEGCDRGYHTSCHSPQLKDIPDFGWFCALCDPSKHCNVCDKDDDDASILLCDGCDKGYHLYCLSPPMVVIPKGKWYCNECNPNICCTICNNDDDDDKTILCDQCDKAFHTYCLDPPLKVIPKGDWFCDNCRKEEIEEAKEQYQEEVKVVRKGHEEGKLSGACPEHRKKKKRCPANCPQRLALQEKLKKNIETEKNKRKRKMVKENEERKTKRRRIQKEKK